MIELILIGVTLAAYVLYIEVTLQTVSVMIAIVAALLNIPCQDYFEASTGLTVALLASTALVLLTVFLSEKYRRLA